MKVIILSSNLGNCWAFYRFFGGSCQHVLYCKYPERQECKARRYELAMASVQRNSAIAQAMDVYNRKKIELPGCQDRRSHL